MHFPFFSKRKADAISKGVFLVFLGLFFYTGHWWPGILFALGFTLALKQYLTGRRFDFFITLIFLLILSLFTLIGQFFPFIFPLFFIGMGLYLIVKECYPTQTKSYWNRLFHSDEFRD